MSLRRRNLIQNALLLGCIAPLTHRLFGSTLSSQFHMEQARSIDDFRIQAKALLPADVYDYIEGCPADCLTKEANSKDFQSLRIKPAALPGFIKPDTAIQLFGTRHSLPFLLAPTSFNGLMHKHGDLGVARASGSADVTLVASTQTNVSVAEVAKATPRSLWFQMYLPKKKEHTQLLLQRAEQAGCQAICLTLDTAASSPWYQKNRTPKVPDWLEFPNLQGIVSPNEKPANEHFMQKYYQPEATWNDLAWLCKQTSIPILGKGVMTAEDALKAREHGAAGIVVSNHGGRNLDSGLSTIQALPDIRSALPDYPILLDGGIRRGTDILKALALGANGILIGRPYLYGLAAKGEQGVEGVISLLKKELEVAMILTGCKNIDSITDRIIV